MVPSVTLHDGVEMPQLGFGVFQVPPDDTQKVVEEALAAGYRHIDTAGAYRNERGVGAAIAASGIPREEVFVTTKLWNSQQGHDSTLEAIDKSLGRLGMDHVDLYLIHWPAPPQDLFVDTWRAFEQIREQGRARSIGVSNFRVEDLERLARETDAGADRQPGRAASEVPAGRAARLARRARRRHRGLEPARAGGAARRRRDRRDRRGPREDARRRRSSAGTCSSATSSSPSRSRRSGSSRTSTSSTSS